jgi:FKBP-type peptidyl-prolyl cis-trans isomerase
MFGATPAAEGVEKEQKEEGEEPDDTDYSDEGDEFDFSGMGEGGFEGDEGDEGDAEELDEAALIRLGFTPVTNPATPATTTPATTTTATTATATNTASKTPKSKTPVTTTSNNVAATKTPAKNNGAATPATKPLPPIKTPVASKTPSAEDDKPRLSKRQKKKLRAEEGEKKEGGSAPQSQKKRGMVSLPSGLQYEDTVVGRGAVATKGNKLQMRYKGSLATGQVFDSNMPRGRPFTFRLGAGEVIRGWDEGLQGMRVGGKRTLKIPSALGYGARGAGAKIPPNANLTFEVELIGRN